MAGRNKLPLPCNTLLQQNSKIISFWPALGFPWPVTGFLSSSRGPCDFLKKWSLSSVMTFHLSYLEIGNTLWYNLIWICQGKFTFLSDYLKHDLRRWDKKVIILLLEPVSLNNVSWKSLFQSLDWQNSWKYMPGKIK